MKANNQQKEVIDACIAELEFWRDNNDINSPTNFNEIENIFNAMEYQDIINNYQVEPLIEALKELLTQIIRLNR